MSTWQVTKVIYVGQEVAFCISVFYYYNRVRIRHVTNTKGDEEGRH